MNRLIIVAGEHNQAYYWMKILDLKESDVLIPSEIDHVRGVSKDQSFVVVGTAWSDIHTEIIKYLEHTGLKQLYLSDLLKEKGLVST